MDVHWVVVVEWTKVFQFCTLRDFPECQETARSSSSQAILNSTNVGGDRSLESTMMNSPFARGIQ